MLKSILSKLWLFIMALVIVILLGFWFFNITLLDKFYINDRINSFYERGETLGEFIKEDQFNESLRVYKIPKDMEDNIDEDYRNNNESFKIENDMEINKDSKDKNNKNILVENQTADLVASKVIRIEKIDAYDILRPIEKHPRNELFYYFTDDDLNKMYFRKLILSNDISNKDNIDSNNIIIKPSDTIESDDNTKESEKIVLNQNGDFHFPFFIEKERDNIAQKIKTKEKFNLIGELDRGDKTLKSIIIGVPVKKDDELLGYIFYYSVVQNLSTATDVLKKQFAYMGIISIFIAFIFAYIIAKYFTRPIKNMQKITDEITKGNYTKKVEFSSKDEIGMLASSINNMAFELAKVENLRRDLIANISHEFKTPLTLIRTYSEMIRDIDMDDNEAINEDIDTILEQTNRLDTMVKDILYLSKLESHNVELEIEDINLNEFFYSLKENIKPFLDEKNIKFNLSCDKNLKIKADYNKLFQCVLNILINSINHSENDKNLFVDIIKEDKIIIKIRDEGIGIKKDELDSIWERFYKTDKSRREGGQGTGLGMNIIKNILDLHGFDYKLESEYEKGTSFYIYID